MNYSYENRKYMRLVIKNLTDDIYDDLKENINIHTLKMDGQMNPENINLAYHLVSAFANIYTTSLLKSLNGLTRIDYYAVKNDNDTSTLNYKKVMGIIKTINKLADEYILDINEIENKTSNKSLVKNA